MRYGILIGRFQPLHSGHQSIINEIMHDGLTPVVLIGSSATVNDKNPLSYVERSLLINKIYGGDVVTLPLPDSISDVYWANSTRKTLANSGINPKDSVIYFHHKDGDFDISTLLPDFNFKAPQCNHAISATDIRADVEKHKRYLDGRSYRLIKKTTSNP